MRKGYKGGVHLSTGRKIASTSSFRAIAYRTGNTGWPGPFPHFHIVVCI